jgi:hypothetical protein
MKLLASGVFIGAMAWGQCAMCFRTAESQTRRRAEALNKGIVILFVPLASAAATIAYVAYRRRA